MKATAIGFLLGTTSLSAASTDLFTGVPAQALSGSGYAILGLTIWYLLSRAFPAHTKALRDTTDAFLAAQKRERRENRKSLDGLARAIRRAKKR